MLLFARWCLRIKIIKKGGGNVLAYDAIIYNRPAVTSGQDIVVVVVVFSSRRESRKTKK